MILVLKCIIEESKTTCFVRYKAQNSEGKNMKKKKIYLYEEKENVFLEATLHKDKKQADKRPAVIVCPGGGYLVVGTTEGSPSANKFFSKGFNTFVLNYSILSAAKFDENNPDDFAPVKDLERAVDYIRNNAGELNIDSEKVCIAAFSAGGHLAARYCFTHEDVKEKIKALILVYPMLDFRYKIGPASDMEDVFQTELFKSVSRELFGKFPPDESAIKKFSNHVLLDEMSKDECQDIPPLFIHHAKNDKIVSFKSTEDVIEILDNKNILYEAFLTEDGIHANPFYDSAWFESAISWLNKILA